MRKLLLIISALVVLVGCGSSGSPAAPTAAPTSPPAVSPTTDPATQVPTTGTGITPTPDASTGYPGPLIPYPAPGTQPTPAGSPDQAPPELANAARQRLAEHLGVTADTLALQSAAPQEWPDASLGCPAPNTAYDQVILPGYLLLFSDGTNNYELHTTLQVLPGEPLVLCENAQPVDLSAVQAPPAPDATGQAMIDLAKQDLAQKLGVDAASITLVSINPVEWNDSSLGCPQPERSYLQVVTPGFLIKLEAQGTTYEYHTDSNSQIVQCLP